MTTESASLDNLRVLFQSDDYIVVDKHWDIRIDSKMWYEKQTVQAQLQHHFPHLADPSTYYGFRFRITITLIALLTYIKNHNELLSHHSAALSSGSVTNWISPPAELFALPSIRLLQDGLIAASRTGLSPKPTCLWYGAQAKKHLMLSCTAVKGFSFAGQNVSLCG